MKAAGLVEQLEHSRARVIADLMAEATAAYWIRRAEQFEWARPRIGDFNGQSTPEYLRAKYDELTEIAQACRNRAAVALWSAE